MLQDYQRQHYESVLKVIDVIPPGIVLPVTDIKSNKFKEAINDRALRARAKNRNKKDLLAYHILYRLCGTLNSIYLLFLQAGIRFTRASFPGAPWLCTVSVQERGQGWWAQLQPLGCCWSSSSTAESSFPGGQVGWVRLGVCGTLWSAELLLCCLVPTLGRILSPSFCCCVCTQGVRGNPLPNDFKSFLYVQK